jgi:hypothetical protein
MSCLIEVPSPGHPCSDRSVAASLASEQGLDGFVTYWNRAPISLLCLHITYLTLTTF